MAPRAELGLDLVRDDHRYRLPRWDPRLWQPSGDGLQCAPTRSHRAYRDLGLSWAKRRLEKRKLSGQDAASLQLTKTHSLRGRPQGERAEEPAVPPPRTDAWRESAGRWPDGGRQQGNVTGRARVTRIGTAGHIAPGTRCPVTGWVRHTSRDVIAVELEGGETLLVTRHHRLFSAERGDWVPAGDLRQGEALQTKDGLVHTRSVGTESLGAVEVFNLEVFGAHRYFVGEHKVLAHNTYAGGVKIGGEAWRVFQAGEKACQSGCETAAQAIQKAIGGEIRTIVSPGGPRAVLGGVRNAAGEFVNPAGGAGRGWFSHTFVLKGGRVYDALTGPSGMTTDAYKALWEYGDAINFGF